jgi:hypothetical protein
MSKNWFAKCLSASVFVCMRVFLECVSQKLCPCVFVVYVERVIECVWRVCVLVSVSV